MSQFIRNIWQLIAPYWRSPEKKIASLLLAGIISLSLGEVYINVQLNKWNKEFYDALQAMDKRAFFAALAHFLWLALSLVITIVYKVYVSQMLQIRWRRWLTGSFLDRWLDRQIHYRMSLSGTTDNPDQRISEDVGQFVDQTLGLSLGLLSSIVTLSSFLFILWNLSGAITIPFGSFGQAHIPGYMVWMAMLYAMAGTWVTSRLGWPLINLNFLQQKFEADFRFALVRFRENSEKIALYRGEEQEKSNFITRFTNIFENFQQIMKRQKTLTSFTAGYYQIATIFPFLVAAPRYFSQQMQFGALMQTASAFGQVQGSFSYIINVYSNIASWKAVVQRLNGFTTDMDKAMARAEQPGSFKAVSTHDTTIRAENMNVHLPGGEPLLKNVNLTINKGDTVLISGPSGSGKSTMLRILAGIWPFAEGTLEVPKDATTLFFPQNSYLPLGTLRHALCYPFPPVKDDEKLRDILRLCRLGHLADKLNDTENWAHVLSPGEQQRLAFAKAMLIRPDLIFMDESTSALDEATEAALYVELRKQLPDATIVSAGHRKTLQAWHDRILKLAETGHT